MEHQSFKDISILNKSLVCLGNFDGVHRGHQRVLETSIEEAKRRQLTSILFTFTPHPSTVVGRTPVSLIFSDLEKIDVLKSYSFDHFLFQKFDRDFSTISPDEFVENVLIKGLKARVIVVGRDFRFGFRGQGTADLMRKYSELDVVECDDVCLGSETVSSSKIRNLLSDGDLVKANDNLGNPYFVDGVVERGSGVGREMGFPTLNISFQKNLLLPRGVYACLLKVKHLNQFFVAATNWGIRPTIDGRSEKLESHLLDFVGDLYGSSVRCYFFKKLRPELLFSGVEELRSQIKQDVKEVREFFDLGNLCISKDSAAHRSDLKTSKQFQHIKF